MSARASCGRRPRGFTLLEVLIVLGVILILTSLVLGVGSAVLKGAEGAQARAALLTMESALVQWEAETGRAVTYNGIATYPSGVTDELFDVREPPGVPPAPNNVGNKAIVAKARGAGVYAVNLLMQVESIKPILAGLPAGILRPEANSSSYPAANIGTPSVYLPSAKSQVNLRDSSRSEFVDPWGNRIAFVFPGREYRIGVDTGNPDPDGTVRTALENLVPGFGVCASSRICLVSAGPDGIFGVDGDAPTSLTGAARAEYLRTAAADNVYLYELDPPN